MTSLLNNEAKIPMKNRIAADLQIARNSWCFDRALWDDISHLPLSWRTCWGGHSCAQYMAQKSTILESLLETAAQYTVG